jgi:hypothetical protein
MKRNEFSNIGATRGVIQIGLGSNLYENLEANARTRDERVADIALHVAARSDILCGIPFHVRRHKL